MTRPIGAASQDIPLVDIALSTRYPLVVLVRKITWHEVGCPRDAWLLFISFALPSVAGFH